MKYLGNKTLLPKFLGNQEHLFKMILILVLTTNIFVFMQSKEDKKIED